MGGAVLFNKSAPGCAQTPSCLLNITNSTFAQNTASMAGGAVHILTDSLQVILDNNTFSENSAQYCGGLCLQTTSNSSRLLRIKGNNTLFSGNWAGESAGLRVNASDVQLSGFIFQNNSATSGHGGGLHVQQLLALRLDDCQFLQNSGRAECQCLLNSGRATCGNGLQRCGCPAWLAVQHVLQQHISLRLGNAELVN